MKIWHGYLDKRLKCYVFIIQFVERVVVHVLHIKFWEFVLPLVVFFAFFLMFFCYLLVSSFAYSISHLIAHVCVLSGYSIEAHKKKPIERYRVKINGNKFIFREKWTVWNIEIFISSVCIGNYAIVHNDNQSPIVTCN